MDAEEVSKHGADADGSHMFTPHSVYTHGELVFVTTPAPPCLLGYPSASEVR